MRVGAVDALGFKPLLTFRADQQVRALRPVKMATLHQHCLRPMFQQRVRLGRHFGARGGRSLSKKNAGLRQIWRQNPCQWQQITAH